VLVNEIPVAQKGCVLLFSKFFICALQRRMIKEEGSEGEEAVSLVVKDSFNSYTGQFPISGIFRTGLFCEALQFGYWFLVSGKCF
jgi:hypothetical protein